MVRPLGLQIELTSPEQLPTGSNRPVLLRTSAAELVAFWEAKVSELSGNRVDVVFGQRLGGELEPLGPAFMVSPEPEYESDFEDQLASAANIADGDFVVVWQSYERDGDFSGVFGQRFNGSAARLGTTFQVNTTTEYYQSGPSVARSDDGGFVVVWNNRSGEEVVDLYQQAFSSAGVPVGTEALVAESAASPPQARGAVEVDSNGAQMVAIWSEVAGPGGTPTDGYEVYARVLTHAPPSSSFIVNSTTLGEQFRDDVVVRADGSFVVTWRDRPGALETTDARVRVLGADASPLGPVVSLDSPLQVADRSRIALAPDEATFIVLWLVGPRSTDGVAVYGQLFRSTGAKVGEPFIVADTDDSFEVLRPAITYVDPEHFVVAWTHEFVSVPGQTTPPNIVYLQRFEIGFLDPTCGDANTSGFYEVTDALVILQSALDLAVCDACICDLDHNGTIAATDALRMLQNVVGRSNPLACPACSDG